MSELPEDVIQYTREDDSETGSTIFSAPEEKTDRVKKPKLFKRLIIPMIALILIAAITVVSIIFIPKPDEESVSSGVEENTLISTDNKNYSSLLLTREKDSLEFYAVNETTDSTSSNATDKYIWLLKGYDRTLISESSTLSAVNALLGLKYAKIISESIDSDDAYGFDKPIYTVDATTTDGNKITITVGKKSPDLSGYYVKKSGEEKVYFVKTDYLYSFDVTPLDLANVPTVKAFAEAEGSAEYYYDGTLAKFDSLSFKNTLLSETYVFGTASGSEGLSSFNTYKVVSPVKRWADDEKFANILKLFSNGISVDGLYSFTKTDEDIKSFGLDEPQIEVSIAAGAQRRTIKATLQPDGNYALITDDGASAILKVSASELPFAKYDKADIFSSILFAQALNEVKEFTFEAGGSKNTVIIVTEKEEDDNVASITGVQYNGGETTKAKEFQSYYTFLLGVVAVSYEETDISGKKPDATITMTKTDGSEPILVEYYADPSGRYQTVVNGVQMGQISSSNFKNIQKYLDNVIAGKAYNS